MKKTLLAMMSLAALSIPSVGLADPWTGDCAYLRSIGPSNTRPNNNYGAACGLFSQSTADQLTAQHFIVAYCNNAIPGCPSYNTTVDTPSSSPAGGSSNRPACSTLAVKTICTEECYTPGQSLMFGGTYQSIDGAYRSSAATVSALAPGSTADSLNLSEQPIQEFVQSRHDGDVYQLTLDRGQTIEVTGNHPMVNSEGMMVPAQALAVGDALMTTEGDLTSIVSISKRTFSGTVWNLRPTSTKKEENVLVVNGVLTGSIRFQNQWKVDVGRLLRTDAFDVSSL